MARDFPRVGAAPPMSEAERRERYARQQGVASGERVTAAQRRRIKHKANSTLADLERAAREQEPQ